VTLEISTTTLCRQDYATRGWLRCFFSGGQERSLLRRPERQGSKACAVIHCPPMISILEIWGFCGAQSDLANPGGNEFQQIPSPQFQAPHIDERIWKGQAIDSAGFKTRSMQDS